MALAASSWVLPRIDWGPPLDVATDAPPSEARLLATWPPTEFENTATDCFSLGDQIWIWQPEVGAVRFSLHQPLIVASLWPGGDAAWFREVLYRSWLPAIYPLWGRQVLHASAIMCAATGDAVAFTGSTHAGKSTTAYGMSRREKWERVCDDTLAFSIGGTRNTVGSEDPPASSPDPAALRSDPPTVLLHPLPQEGRLRPASAEYYGVTDRPDETLAWPDRTPVLKAAYVLEGDATFAGPAEFARLRVTEALPLLLQQAYALSFGIPKYNQQLMKDYLALASAVPVFRLRYRRSFDVAEELFTAIERHLASEAGVDG